MDVGQDMRFHAVARMRTTCICLACIVLTCYAYQSSRIEPIEHILPVKLGVLGRISKKWISTIANYVMGCWPTIYKWPGVDGVKPRAEWVTASPQGHLYETEEDIPTVPKRRKTTDATTKKKADVFLKFHSSWVALFTVTTVDSSLNVHIWISPWPFIHHSRIPATVYRNNENKEQTQSRIPLIFGKKQNPSCVSPVVVKKEQKAKPHYRHPEEPNRLIKKR